MAAFLIIITRGRWRVMRFRDKLLIQTVICLGIFTLVRASSMFGARWIEDIRSAIGEMACANYTIEDIKEKGFRAVFSSNR